MDTNIYTEPLRSIDQCIDQAAVSMNGAQHSSMDEAAARIVALDHARNVLLRLIYDARMASKDEST